MIVDQGSRVRFYKIKNSTVHKVYIKIFRIDDDMDTEFMYHHFGGYYYVKDSKCIRDQKNYWLNIQQHRAVRLMQLLLPYLTLRKEVVESILAYYDSKKKNKKRRLTAEMKAERDQIYKNYKEAQARFMECVKKSKS